MLVRASFLLFVMSCNVSFAGLFGDDKAREQISVLRSQVDKMEVRVAKMEEALKSQALLELYSQVETMGIELGKMRGQLEVLNNDGMILQKRQRDFYIDLDGRLRQIEQPGVPILPVLPPDSEPAPLSDETTTTSELVAKADESSSVILPITELVPANSTESSAYEAAYGLFLNGDYAGAILQFKDFLQNYAKSSLAPGAAYWIGNAHYASRDFQDAIDAQKKLMRIYPESQKVPDALLNIASSQQEMADRNAAKQTLEELVAKYPSSEAAGKAKERLAKL